MKRIIIFLVLISAGFQSCNKEDVLKAVMNKVKLDKHEASLITDTNLQLTPSIDELETKSTDFTWISSDKTIAEVSESGLVKALKQGEAIITVKAKNQTTDTCKITVTGKLAKNVKLNKEKLNLKISTNSLLIASQEGEEFQSTDYIWESADETIAEVTKTGLVKALKEGNTVITVKAPNQTSAKCEVTVTNETVHITSFNIDSTEKELIVGNTRTLTTNIVPFNATNQDIVWKSSNNEVATINTEGKLTAIKSGTVDITATIVEENKTATCTFDIRAESIEVTNLTIPVSEVIMDLENFREKYLIIYYTPNTATDKTVKWKSSNAIVAEVTFGKVVAKTPGEAIITATASNGVSTSCKIIVKEPATTEKRFMIDPAMTLTNKDGKYLNFVKFHDEDASKNIVWTISSTDKIDFKRNSDGKIDTGAGCPIMTLKDGAITGDKATVTATMDGEVSTCVVSVNKDSDYLPVSGISTNPVYLYMGKTKLRQYYFKFDKYTNEEGRRVDPTNTKVHCYIFDESIAKANENGDIISVKVGMTKALVWSDDAGYGAFIEIEIRE